MGKALKLNILISSVLFWAGIILYFISSNSDQKTGLMPIIAILMVTIGIIWFIISKVIVWWKKE